MQEKLEGKAMLEIAGGILIAVGVLVAIVILLPVVFALIGQLIEGLVNGAASLLMIFAAGALLFAPLALVGFAIEYLFPEQGANGAVALVACAAVGYVIWDTYQFRRWKAANRDLISTHKRWLDWFR